MTTTTGQPGLARALGWAGYLGVSWTWCIGMFLPVLLLYDYGWWAVIVFAVPNIVGAAAMGWVLKEGDSQRLVREHGVAMLAFSWVTVWFHVMFLGRLGVWAERPLGRLAPTDEGFDLSGVTLKAALVVAVASGVVGSRRGKAGGPVLAWSLWACSLTLMVAYIAMWSVAYSGPRINPALFDWPWSQLAGLGPSLLAAGGLMAVCVVGFAACPYLDLTFHEARQSTNERGARVAFGVGFGLVFAAMIGFTLVYSTALGTMGVLSVGMLGAVVAHVVLQSGFTIGRHARGAILGIGGGGPHWGWRLAMPLATLVACIGTVGLSEEVRHTVQFSSDGSSGTLVRFERWYPAMMGFYGLVFPAYLIVCMLPVWRGCGQGPDASRLRRERLGVFIGTLVLAAPWYLLGFVGWRDREMDGPAEQVWIAGIGVIILIGAGALSFRLGRRPLGGTESPS